VDFALSILMEINQSRAILLPAVGFEMKLQLTIMVAHVC
jgi:hypothetical protein